MPREHDYTPDRPSRPRRRDDFEPEEDYEDRDDTVRVAEVPGLVRTAGIIWIVFGGLILVNAGAGFLIRAANAPAGQGAQTTGAYAAGGMCGAIFNALIGAAFIYVGVQSVKGTATDTLGNGIGSIILGLLPTAGGALMLFGGALFSAGAAGANAPAAGLVGALLIAVGGVSLISGLGLMVAGVLALVGRADYKAYRRALKAGRRRDDY